MKTQPRRISILRHAKAEPSREDAMDHDRPLAPRGQEDAAHLGALLKRQHWQPQLVLCSTAARTRQTLAGLDLGLMPVILSERIYQASCDGLLALLRETDDAIRDVLLIGHNPGMHTLALTLTGSLAQASYGEMLAEHYPTSGYSSLTANLSHWYELAERSLLLDRLVFREA
jgi:phosphohistidine phosphatase